MKQKFLLLKNEDNSELIIKEFSELDSGLYTLICEETYEMEKIQSSLGDKELLIEEIRTNNLFPISYLIDKMINVLPDFLNTSEQESVEILFKDMEMIKEAKEEDEPEEESKDDVEIDALLEVDDDNLDVKTSDPIDTSIEQISINDSSDDIKKP